MTTHNKTNTQKTIPLGNNIDNTYVVKVQNLENKVAEQSDKFALTKQIDDLKRQLNEAESRIKRLLIRCEQFAEDNNKTEE